MENENKEKAAVGAKTGNIFVILSYLWILCLIPLLLKKDDEFIFFHARQGFTLFIVEVAIGVLGIIPFLGWLIVKVGMLLCAVLSVIAIYQGLRGNEWKIPVISDWAEKISL